MLSIDVLTFDVLFCAAFVFHRIDRQRIVCAYVFLFEIILFFSAPSIDWDIDCVTLDSSGAEISLDAAGSAVPAEINWDIDVTEVCLACQLCFCQSVFCVLCFSF